MKKSHSALSLSTFSLSAFSGVSARLASFLFISLLFFLALFNATNVWAESSNARDIVAGISEYKNTGEGQATTRKKSNSTTDHSKLEELQGPFNSGPEVTRACLKCHNTAGHQFKKNKHWTWEYKDSETGQMLGKKHLVNTFCTNSRGNEGMCAQCHAGYGWKDDNFDFDNEENMDCLVCHESTGKYYKTPTSEGSKACSVMFEGKKPIDWAETAKSVNMPGRANCGKCHFYGGGGDNVKHGDLSSALLNPDKELDVHMDAKGLNFDCTTCHIGEGHEWAGSRYEMSVAGKHDLPKPGMKREVASCKSCHSDAPHSISTVAGNKLNSHIQKVACETCHISTFARGGVATKTDWDWRTIGKLKNGEGYNESSYTQGDGEHRYTYKSIKGTFKYAENLEPTYHWFNGKMNFLTIDQKFDPKKLPVEVNHFKGSVDDPDSRIYPFKVMRTIQPYDKTNNTLVYMELWGDNTTSLWGNYNFEKAIKVGMEKYKLPYSGEFDFIDTVSYWPINHMVTPKDKALDCQECHAKEGRLKDLKGFYMPGRGTYAWLDLIGLLLILGTLGGVFMHALIRLIASKKRSAS